MKLLFSTLLIVLFLLPAFSQEQQSSIAFAKIVDGDTIPIVELKEVNISSYRILKKNRDIRKWRRLVKNVKKVYPYAKIAGYKLGQYNEILLATEDEKERKKIIKKAEKEIKSEFGDDLKRLTITQGKILLRLIDRETGNSSYNLVKDLRGGFSAFFYQTFALLFGYNLKVKYDPLIEDNEIELIVMMIESGKI